MQNTINQQVISDNDALNRYPEQVSADNEAVFREQTNLSAKNDLYNELSPSERTDQAHEPEQLTGNYKVRAPNQETRTYSVNELSKAILSGEISKTDQARPEGGNKDEWFSIEQIAANHFALRLLYEPMWAHINRGCWAGVLTGVALKLLDTTVALFIADPSGAAGLVFLMVTASLFLTRYFALAPLVAVFISIQAGFTINFFFMFLGAAFVGVLAGAPAGALIGGIVGYFRKNSLPKAPDSLPEGSSPYLWGMLAPAVFLSAAIPFYFFWLMPKLIEWVAASN